jgi:hypothetical protein
MEEIFAFHQFIVSNNPYDALCDFNENFDKLSKLKFSLFDMSHFCGTCFQVIFSEGNY